MVSGIHVSEQTKFPCTAKRRRNFAEAVSKGVVEKPSEGSAKETKGEPIGEPAEKSSDWATSKESRSSGKDIDTRDEGEGTWSLVEHLGKRKVKTIHGKKELGVSSESQGLRVARKRKEIIGISTLEIWLLMLQKLKLTHFWLTMVSR